MIKPEFHLARHVSTRHVRRVEPMHFGCVELVEQHGSTRSSRRARHVERVVSRRAVTSHVEFGFYRVAATGRVWFLMQYVVGCTGLGVDSSQSPERVQIPVRVPSQTVAACQPKPARSSNSWSVSWHGASTFTTYSRARIRVRNNLPTRH